MAGSIIAAAPSVLGLGLMYHLARVLFALERGRFAMIGTSAGWCATALLAWVLAATTVVGTDAVGALRALGLASGIGSLIGAGVLAWSVARQLGGSALAGVARTGGAALLGAGLGAGAGLAINAALVVDSTLGSVLVGVLVGAVAAAITVASVALLDRASLRAVLRRPARSGDGAGDTSTELTGDDR